MVDLLDHVIVHLLPKMKEFENGLIFDEIMMRGDLHFLDHMVLIQNQSELRKAANA